MKKIAVLILCAALLMAAALAEGAVGMPNPIVEVKDDDEFERVLGIDVDADDLPSRDVRMSIIGGKVGQIVFNLENVNGDSVEWVLRFTKDASLDRSVEGFAGIYDASCTAPETRAVPWQDDPDDPVEEIELTSVVAPTVGCDIYFWSYRGTYYALTINGDYSQMQFAAAMDSIFEACLDD